MSDTPRTDKAIVEANDWTPPNVFSLCQQLERELAAVKAKSEERRAVLEDNQLTDYAECRECGGRIACKPDCAWAKAMREDA